MKLVFKQSKMTYGHRRMKCMLDKLGFSYCLETVRKLMKKIKLQPTMFNNRFNKKYSSYRGKLEKFLQTFCIKILKLTNHTKYCIQILLSSN
ncbi:IS3 family transposase [Apilactobacillus ozensis]|uniref:IS3 family transposase n=1 Tax=Apilactobacillus ozensis TaxID=866801 RepID=UPI0012E39CEE